MNGGELSYERVEFGETLGVICRTLELPIVKKALDRCGDLLVILCEKFADLRISTVENVEFNNNAVARLVDVHRIFRSCGKEEHG